MMSEDTTLSGVAQKAGRRRRPSGEPPPLVRGIGWQRWAWGLLGVVLLGVVLAIGEATDAVTGLDRAVTEAAADLRTPALVDVAKAVDLLTAVPLIMVLRWGTVLALAVLGRFRHMVLFLTTFVVTDWVVARALNVALEPPDVTALADAGTYAFPSLSIAALAITLVGISLVLVPRGAARRTATWLLHGALFVVVVAELILATDYVIPMGFSWVFATVLAGAAFRTFVPEDVFPVTLQRGGNAAHLDLGGERGEAIVRAMRDQLGLTVTSVEPFGLEGSGGSSPLRMTLDDGVPRLREGVLDQPRTRRPLVSGGPGGPVRPTGGRDADGLGAAARDLRGLCASLPARRWGWRRANLRRRRADPEPRVHARHGVLRGRPEPQRLGRG